MDTSTLDMTGLSAAVLLWLNEPAVEGNARPNSIEIVVNAASVSQGPWETSIINGEGEIMATFDTASINKILWVVNNADINGASSWLQQVRSQHSNAYAPWSSAEDKQLLLEEDDGLSVQEMAKSHNRTVGAINSRLSRLRESETSK
jgi:hypothetical protein